jgi:hypothetical protein
MYEHRIWLFLCLYQSRLARYSRGWHPYLMNATTSTNISINEKARSINLSKSYFGTIAEIGAGQEIARWFFKVGGASGTIAKAISAYDMAFSDAIYGNDPSGRYVVESRLHRMLDYEYDLLETRSKQEIKTKRKLFCVANTVAAKSPKYKGDCHGWIGIKYQSELNAPPNQIILHLRLLDSTNLQQQETLGTLGVNLFYAAINCDGNIDRFVDMIADSDLRESLEINLIRVSGPDFKGIDQIEANLELLRADLTQALIINADGKFSHLAEELYQKQILLHRAGYDPVCTSDLDMHSSAREHYCSQKTEGLCAPLMLSEIYVDKLDTQTRQHLLHRLRMLLLTEQNIIISKYHDSFELMDYLALFTNDHVHMVYPSKKLVNIFEKDEIQSFEAFARIFSDKTRMYFYPTPNTLVDAENLKDPKAPYLTIENFKSKSSKYLLFQYLITEGYLEDIKGHHCDLSLLISDRQLQDMVKAGDSQWTKYVPEVVANYIKANKLYK